MSAQYKLIRCTINGRKVEQMVDVRASLTDMLRNDFRLTSVKKGCEVGECGACNVLVDGECFNSCLYLAAWADGKEIRTLEGLLGPGGELADIQQAFIDEAAIQCGFCTPGFIMTAVEILESGKEYSDDELRKLLSGHLCRCTGYENILRAVRKTMLRRLGKEACDAKPAVRPFNGPHGWFYPTPRLRSVSSLRSGKGITGAGASVCSPRNFSIQIKLYQRPNL